MFKSISEEEFKALDEKGQAAYIVAKNANDLKEMGEKLKKAEEKSATKEDLDGLKSEILKLKDARVDVLEKALKTQGKEMADVVEKIKNLSTGETKSFKGALLEALNAKSADLKTLVAQKSGAVELEVKAFQDAADITSGLDFAQMESGVSQIPTRQPFVRELFQNATTNREYIKYTEQETVVRDAKNVAGCDASTHNTKITWIVNDIQMKKIRDFVDVCFDMMEDYDFVQSEIQTLVGTDVALKVDQQLLLGTGTGDELNSVDSVSSTHVAGDYALKVTSPTLSDLITVVGCQISDLGQNNSYNPNFALLNPTDSCLMKLEKDANGNYLLPSWVTSDGVNIGSIRVITNQLVTINSMYVGDFSKGTVFSRKGATVQFGFENNDNFEREVVTVKAYERLNLRVKNNDKNAFMKVTDIAAALLAITKP